MPIKQLNISFAFKCILFFNLFAALALCQPPQLFGQEIDNGQVLQTFELIVKDSDGDPIAGAKVKPWALRGSTGHGGWRKESAGGTEPTVTTTDSDGKSTVTFPKFKGLEERVSTTAVTVSIDHPNHPYVSHEDISVPCTEAHVATLPPGAAIEATLAIDGQHIVNDQIRGIWTGGRAWRNGDKLSVTADGNYHIPPLAEGDGQLMFIRFDGKTPTHYSPIANVTIDSSEKIVRREIELFPAVTVRGTLGDSVPRPVKNGRIKVETIGDGKSWDEISWFTWSIINEDGTFVIESWPQKTALQLTALCDGFIAKSGVRPPSVSPERAGGNHLRAQCFSKPDESEITVEMVALGTVTIELKNSFGKKLTDCKAMSNPNIGWWNGGAQLYGWPLVSGSEFLLTGKYERRDGEGIFAQPFKGTSDKDGVITLQLPVGPNRVWVESERYQLPITSGRRARKINVESDQPLNLKLVLQPKGLDVLGDWEDLCGLVFG